MWMISVLRRWYALPSYEWVAETLFSCRLDSLTAEAYGLLRQLKTRLRDLVLHTATDPYRVFIQGKLACLTDLKTFKHFYKSPSLVKFFSTWNRDDASGTLTVQALTNQRVVRICDAARSRISDRDFDQEIFVRALDQFQDILLMHQHEVNAVNVATMIHRIGCLADLAGIDPCSTHSFLLKQLIDTLREHIHEMRPQQISNVIWGLGKIKQQSIENADVFPDIEELLLEIVDHGVQCLDKFSAQNISNLLLGLSYLNNGSCHGFLPAIMERSKRILNYFKPQELSNTIWALAKLKYVDVTNILPKVLRRVERSLVDFSANHMAMLIWSLAVFRYQDCMRLIQQILQQLAMRRFCSYTLSIVLWSAQQLQIRPSDSDISALLQACDQLQAAVLTSDQVRDRVLIVTTLADFGFRSTDVEALRDNLRKLFSSKPSLFTAQDVCNCLWAMLITDDPHLQSAFVRQSFQRLQQLGLDTLKDEDIRQFYQCLLHLKVFHPERYASTILPANVEMRWKAVWSVRQATSPLPLWVSSALVTLEDMGYVCKGRFLEQGLINTCTVDLSDDLKYAVEGISFLRSYRNQPSTTTARFRWKLRLLESMGYEIICIEERGWVTLTKTSLRQTYLKAKIKEAQSRAANKLMAFVKRDH